VSLTPEIATVGPAGAAFPPIAIGETGACVPSYTIQIDPEVALGQIAVFELHLTTTEGYTSRTSFSLMIGISDHTNPLGPDAYGYYAYDNSDTDYPDSAPLYEWIPCSTLYGGSGEKLSLRDNTAVTLDLPFPFVFYGRTYNQVLISDNGWVSFDTSSYYDFCAFCPATYGSGTNRPFWG
jgi:hypothetical protein